MKDLVLPAFALDCRDWLVMTPAQADVPDEIQGAPVLAVLSTAVLADDHFRAATAVISVGLFDPTIPRRAVAPGGVAARLDDGAGGDPHGLFSADPDPIRYVLPAPDGHLALVAEFATPDGVDDEVEERIDALMASFRWAA